MSKSDGTQITEVESQLRGVTPVTLLGDLLCMTLLVAVSILATLAYGLC